MSRRSRVREDISTLLKVGRIAKAHDRKRKQELTGEIKSAEGITYKYNKLALIDPLFDPKEGDTVSFSVIELSPGEFIAAEVQECTQETYAAGGTPKKTKPAPLASRSRKAPLKESNRNSLSSEIVYRAGSGRPKTVVKIRKTSAEENSVPKTPKNYGLKETFSTESQEDGEEEEEEFSETSTEEEKKNTVNYSWGETEGYGTKGKLFKSIKLTFKSTVEIKIGEYALVQDEASTDNFFVCRVEELYESDGEKLAEVTWCLMIDDYHKSIRRSRNRDQLRINDYYDDEVVMIKDGMLQTRIDVESIVWKARVFHADHRQKMYGDYGMKDKRYFCRWVYDGANEKLSNIDKWPRDLKKLSALPKKETAPSKKMSRKEVMQMFEESSDDEHSDDIQSPKKSKLKLKKLPDSDEESSEELPVVRARKQSSASSASSASSSSSRRSSARRRLLIDEEKEEPERRSSRRKSDSSVSYSSSEKKKSSKKSTLSSISETPSKALGRELEKMNLKTSPKRTRRPSTRRSVAVVQSTPTKQQKKTTRKSSKTTTMSIAEEPETPSKVLAKDVENLSIRRSSRRSAANATAAIKFGNYKEKYETLQCKTDEKLQRVEKGYKPECSSDSSEGSSGDTSSEVETDSDDAIMKTPRKRPRGWRGAKTPTKTPCKTPKKLATKTPMKTPSKKGMADAVYKKSAAPSRQVLPDEILKSNDLLSILDQTSKRLDINSVPESLPCREDQYQNIYNFIEDKIKHNTGGCLYISGVPGTGKTATTHEVITALREEAENGKLKKYKFVDVNGMRMTTPKQVYSAIWSQLTGEKRTADHASELLEAKFAGKENARGKTEPILMLVDELDQLMTRKQDVLYRIFDWPQRSKLIVIAIANTFDLPERVMMRRVASRLGLSRETFNPYTFKQLEEIIRARLGPNLSRLFEDTGLAFVSRKVASLSGDARRCLEICRQSVEQSILRYEETKDPRSVYITLDDIIKAVNAVSCNPAIVMMKACPTFAQIFLRGTVAAFRSLGVEEASVDDVIDHSGVIAHMDGERKPESFELLQVAGYLETVGLILVDNIQSGIHAKVRLNVSPEDVLFALNTEKK